jgi:hypothetical protein
MPEAAKNVTQPQAATQMCALLSIPSNDLDLGGWVLLWGLLLTHARSIAVMNVADGANKAQQQIHEEHQHKHGKASRIRGGGAGKVCTFTFDSRLIDPLYRLLYEWNVSDEC